jgi:biopolymer transport protein ExbD
MGMNLGGGGKNKISPQMNVTPLVDVVLVLLIIFMVVTPLLTKKFALHVPKKEDRAAEPPPPDPDAPKPVVLQFHRDGSILINSEIVPRGALADKVARILAARPDPVVFFDADGDAEYGGAVEVMDVAKGAGATIAVLTEAVTQ